MLMLMLMRADGDAGASCTLIRCMAGGATPFAREYSGFAPNTRGVDGDAAAVVRGENWPLKRTASVKCCTCTDDGGCVNVTLGRGDGDCMGGAWCCVTCTRWWSGANPLADMPVPQPARPKSAYLV